MTFIGTMQPCSVTPVRLFVLYEPTQELYLGKDNELTEDLEEAMRLRKNEVEPMLKQIADDSTPVTFFPIDLQEAMS